MIEAYNGWLIGVDFTGMWLALGDSPPRVEGRQKTILLYYTKASCVGPG